uniref:Uncharacterized protein n=1 Tax=Oryza punctata TaxID=4537 RepID=A0A0E0JZF2_ORYPU
MASASSPLRQQELEGAKTLAAIVNGPSASAAPKKGLQLLSRRKPRAALPWGWVEAGECIQRQRVLFT